MPITFSCPSCQASLTLSDAAAGRRGKCPHCKAELVVPSPGVTTAPPLFTAAPPPPPPPPLPPLPEMGYDEPLPQGAPPGNYQAHRGPAVLTLGIVGDVLTLVSALGFCITFCCPVIGIIPALAAVGLSLTALLMGRADLAKINAGEMNPEGRGMTMGGFVCGIVGTILGSIILLVTLVWTMIWALAPTPQPFTGFQPLPTTNRIID